MAIAQSVYSVHNKLKFYAGHFQEDMTGTGMEKCG